MSIIEEVPFSNDQSPDKAELSVSSEITDEEQTPLET